MPHDDRVYLQHILDSILRIESYLQAVDEATFHQQSMIQDVVVRQIKIIGEAVKRLFPALRAQHSDIPWQDIARMRDKLIHDYFGVDLEKVWDTTKADIPPLKAKVSVLLS